MNSRRRIACAPAAPPTLPSSSAQADDPVLANPCVGHWAPPQLRGYWMPAFAGMTVGVSFDHLVGAGEYVRRNFEAQRLSGFEIDR